ncbi:MAG: biosynthetic-type acetolactate synthase large subunit [Candidatus Schekmanbacteria bacterium]|nr:biosynthetic-type acetolactate synthase large subunit [Candidatus Schekmanbacteria bacterium]
MKRIGAKVLVEALEKEGVEVIFGFPGGVVLQIYDELFGSKIRHILTRHEQGAIHAADGYARASGKPGVCLVTSGPGATNTVTGIATAYMDSIPVVIFTGQVPTPMIGNDAFQEADIVGITRPITKHNYLVKDVDDLPRVIKEAFYVATTGRPGPVLVDIPKDVTVRETDVPYPDSVSMPGYNPNFKVHPGQIEEAAQAISAAKRPVFYTGGGIIISGAHEELRQAAELTQIPVTTTLLGLGGFPSGHDLSLGMLGMHGTWYANMAISDADLVIAVGARFDDRVTGKIDEFAPHARIIHVDIDPSSISKNVRVDIPVVGDAKEALRKLLGELKKLYGKDGKTNTCEWLALIREWKQTHPLKYHQSTEIIKPQYVIEEICRLTNGEAIITTEVGQNQMWAAQFYQYKYPRGFISSGGLGTMGFGFPAAIGAQMAFPDKMVFDIAGDGSIQMNIQELATAVQHHLPVKIAILNNHFLGMVRQWQQLFYHKRYSATCLQSNPDFVKLAEAYGALGLRAEKPEDVLPVLQQAIGTPRTVVMDFVISREENVAPMVPAGKALKDMILI